MSTDPLPVARLRARESGHTHSNEIPCDVNDLLRRYDAMAEQLDELRNFHRAPDAQGRSCDLESGECSICGILDCPYGDSLHYHHDGCPSEYVEEIAARQRALQEGAEK